MAKSGFGLGMKDVALSLRALPFLVHASYVLRRQPSQQALRWLGVASDDSVANPATCTPTELSLARQIGRAVQRASRVVPWPCDCMPQAMATCRLLQQERIDHVASIGGRMAGEGETAPARTFYAHAWVSVGDEVVIGQATSDLHTPLARFASAKE